MLTEELREEIVSEVIESEISTINPDGGFENSLLFIGKKIGVISDEADTENMGGYVGVLVNIPDPLLQIIEKISTLSFNTERVVELYDTLLSDYLKNLKEEFSDKLVVEDINVLFKAHGIQLNIKEIKEHLDLSSDKEAREKLESLHYEEAVKIIKEINTKKKKSKNAEHSIISFSCKIDKASNVSQNWQFDVFNYKHNGTKVNEKGEFEEDIKISKMDINSSKVSLPPNSHSTSIIGLGICVSKYFNI